MKGLLPVFLIKGFGLTSEAGAGFGSLEEETSGFASGFLGFPNKAPSAGFFSLPKSDPPSFLSPPKREAFAPSSGFFGLPNRDAPSSYLSPNSEAFSVFSAGLLKNDNEPASFSFDSFG
jgi:hypothetical protein